MLRLTKQTDYGIVLLTQLANAPEQRFAAPELAAETRIPQPMVSKILKILTREGLLDSHRGVKGGYSLAREPQDVSVAEVITALDGPIAFTDCIDDAPGCCSQEDICRLRGNWQRINDAIRQTLESISLAEMIHPLPPPSLGIDPLVQLGANGGRLAAAVEERS